MRVVNIALVALIITAMLGVSTGVFAQTEPFTASELDTLLGPIALYPDPLIAQILPASTYPDQLDAATAFISSGASTSGIDKQSWDVSVRSVAHYPDVLRMMANNRDWTVSLGQAYVNQPADVMASIQRLRDKAKLMGYLNSNAQQTVNDQSGIISIVPAQPQYIYVPTYNPQVVYSEPSTDWGAAAIGFGVGLLIGSWLNNDVNWYGNNVYYHGWHGGGWVNRSRPYVRRNPNYWNNRYQNRPVPYNRNVTRFDTRPYRNELRQNAGTFTPPAGFTPARPVPGARTARPGAVRPTAPGATRVPGVVPGTGVRPTPRAAPSIPGRPGAGAITPTPRVAPRTLPGGTGAGVTTPAPGTRIAPRTVPGAGVTTPSPRVMPRVPAGPGAGVTTPGARVAPRTVPGAGVATPSPRVMPRVPAGPGAGVTTPSPRYTPRAMPSTPQFTPRVMPSVPSGRGIGPSAPRGYTPSAPRSFSAPRPSAPSAPRGYSGGGFGGGPRGGGGGGRSGGGGGGRGRGR